MLHPGVILDRDGTLLEPVRDEETGLFSVAFHPDQIRFLPQVMAGLSELTRAGFRLCIATNQPGPAKGQYSVSAVERTHAALLRSLDEEGIPVAALEVCYHHPQGTPDGDRAWITECECRKPKPGLLRSAILRAELDPARTWMVGDSATDVLAGHAAGLRSALVFSGERCEICPLRGGPSCAPELMGGTLLEIARQILARTVLG